MGTIVFPQKIRMIETTPELVQGIPVRWFHKGTVHEHLGSLARHFVKNRWAEDITHGEPKKTKKGRKKAA